MEKSGKTRLIMFTNGYPFDSSERSFLKEELKYLSARFDEILLAPMKIGDEPIYELPENVLVTKELAILLNDVSFRYKMLGVLSSDFYKELFRTKFSIRKRQLAMGKNIASFVVRDWVKTKIDRNKWDKVVLYSFWFNECALGAVRYKGKFRNVKCASRCHNFDLYGNEENGYYVPFQKFILDGLDGVFPVSQDGAEFLNKRFKTNIEPSIMGVPAAIEFNSKSTDGVIRVVTCSYMIPRKRLDIAARGLLGVCNKYPEINIRWTHIGDGPEKNKILELLKDTPSNFKLVLKGSLSNELVHKYYQSNPVDLFINTSSKEGTPVSIMEAISYGIPIMATGFGGNKEVAEKGAGFVLPIDPDQNDFIAVFEKFLNCNKDDLRISSRDVWNNYYNSDKNYIKFADNLYKL